MTLLANIITSLTVSVMDLDSVQCLHELNSNRLKSHWNSCRPGCKQFLQDARLSCWFRDLDHARAAFVTMHGAAPNETDDRCAGSHLWHLGAPCTVSHWRRCEANDRLHERLVCIIRLCDEHASGDVPRGKLAWVHFRRMYLVPATGRLHGLLDLVRWWP